MYASEDQVKDLWNSFTIVVILATMFRKDGQSQDQTHFLHLLMNVRDAIPIVYDWKLLMSHIDTSLDSFSKKSFNKVIHLFATNEDVNNHNRHSLATLNCPIVGSVVVALSRKCYSDANEEKWKVNYLF